MSEVAAPLELVWQPCCLGLCGSVVNGKSCASVMSCKLNLRLPDEWPAHGRLT